MGSQELMEDAVGLVGRNLFRRAHSMMTLDSVLIARAQARALLGRRRNVSTTLIGCTETHLSVEYIRIVCDDGVATPNRQDSSSR